MFNFLNVSDAKGLWPIVVLAAVGVAGWYVWNKSKQTAAANNISDSTSAVTSGSTTTLADLALLQSLMAGGNTGSTTQLSGSQPTITAGGGFTGSNAPSQAAPSTSGSSTGNTYITQGV